MAVGARHCFASLDPRTTARKECSDLSATLDEFWYIEFGVAWLEVRERTKHSLKFDIHLKLLDRAFCLVKA